MSQISEKLHHLYDLLYAHFGPRHWWPGDSPFEVCVGAILTQNTAWRNVEKAIENLKRAGKLSFEAMNALSVGELAELIRPAGYYNIKATRLKNLLKTISENGTVENFLSLRLNDLREKLLSTTGIGRETADSILLYAAEKPSFVVDLYTHRILSRHGLIGEEADYDEIQALFMDHLPNEVPLYNEYHALIVATGNTYCKKTKPNCAECPLNVMFENAPQGPLP